MKAKQYTEDHEWIDIAADGKTGMSLPFAHFYPPKLPIHLHCTQELFNCLLHQLTNLPPATLGITSFAAKQLGDVVYIELPEEGLEVAAGDAIGAVESVKSASDILSPVGGTVTAVNAALSEKPGNLNKDPEGEAWIAKIEVEGEPVGTMSEEEYKNFVAED